MVEDIKPIFFGIHLKPICNFRCEKCFIGDMTKLQKEDILDIDEIKKIILSGKKNGFKVFFLYHQSFLKLPLLKK